MTANPIVHVELRTADLPRACVFVSRLLGWRAETLRVNGGRYVALEVGGRIDGGVVEEDAGGRALWLPFVEVDDVVETTERAVGLGAAVLVAPREGPAGWRSRIAHPVAGEVAFWQPKR